MRRVGRCTPGCGACCRRTALYLDEARLSDDRAWLEAHGIKLRRAGGGVLAIIPFVCPVLTKRGRCSVYAARPLSCRFWPMTPEDLQELEDPSVCTYRFEEENEPPPSD